MNTISFVKPTIAEIKNSIEKELKTIDFESLKIKPTESITIDPIYSNATSILEIEPFVSDRINFQEFKINSEFEALNNSILEALNNGISGIILTFQSNETIDFYKLLKEVRLDYIYTYIQTQESKIIEEFNDYIKNLKYEVNPQQLFCSIENSFFNHSKTIEQADFIESSAAILNQLKQNEKISTIFIELGGDYFYDLCKIRAFKSLLNGVLFNYNIKRDIIVIGFTSDKNKSKENIEFNILKATTEGMSAMISGCDGIWILPFDNIAREPNHFSQRISRNIFNLMKEESYLDLVHDPSKGSYFIENYTESIAREIYKHLID